MKKNEYITWNPVDFKKNLEFKAKCIIFSDSKLVKDLERILKSNVIDLKYFHRLFWYNGKESGLGLFFVPEVELEHRYSINDDPPLIEALIVYKNASNIEVLAVLHVYNMDTSKEADLKLNITSKDSFDKSSLFKNKFSQFYITTSNAVIKENYDEGYKQTSWEEKLNIQIKVYLLRIKGFKYEYNISRLKKHIIQQLVKIPVYFALKHNILFDPTNSLVKNFWLRRSKRISFKNQLSKTILITTLVFFFLFLLEKNTLDGIYQNIQIWIHAYCFPMISVVFSKYYIMINMLVYGFLTSIFYHIIFIFFEKFVVYVANNALFATFIGSLLVLLFGYNLIKLMNGEQTYKESHIIADFLNTPYVDIGFLQPFRGIVLFKPKDTQKVFTIMELNKEYYRRISEVLNKKVGKKVDDEIYHHYLKESFEHFFSLSGITKFLKKL